MYTPNELLSKSVQVPLKEGIRALVSAKSQRPDIRMSRLYCPRGAGEIQE